MEELPRDVIEARLHLDEQLAALLNAGDDRTLLRTIELVREDLQLFARQLTAHQAPSRDNVIALFDYRRLTESHAPDT
jgi:hypothetical protein